MKPAMGWFNHDGADVGNYDGDGKLINCKNNVNLWFSINIQWILSMFVLYFTGTKPWVGAITMALIFMLAISMEMAKMTSCAKMMLTYIWLCNQVVDHLHYERNVGFDYLDYEKRYNIKLLIGIKHVL